MLQTLKTLQAALAGPWTRSHSVQHFENPETVAFPDLDVKKGEQKKKSVSSPEQPSCRNRLGSALSFPININVSSANPRTTSRKSYSTH
jgi:hypothetical protein